MSNEQIIIVALLYCDCVLDAELYSAVGIVFLCIVESFSVQHLTLSEHAWLI